MILFGMYQSFNYYLNLRISQVFLRCCDNIFCSIGEINVKI